LARTLLVVGDGRQPMTPSSTLIVVERDVVCALREHLRNDPTVHVLDASDAAPSPSQVAGGAQPLLVIGRSFANASASLPFIEQFRVANQNADVRVLADDGTGVPHLLKARVSPPALPALRSASYPLARRTRRSARHRLPDLVRAIVNGSSVQVINLSALGAQVVSTEILRPGQRAQLTLAGVSRTIRIEGLVAWSTLEMDRPTRALRFRAGLAFPNPVLEIETDMLACLAGRKE
jgi:hypothetical protein